MKKKKKSDVDGDINTIDLRDINEERIDLIDFAGKHKDMFLPNYPTINEFIDNLELWHFDAQIRGLRHILALQFAVRLSPGKGKHAQY